ncbi:hypothetical protein NPIL_328931, partial [Nephila pilipes]
MNMDSITKNTLTCTTDGKRKRECPCLTWRLMMELGKSEAEWASWNEARFRASDRNLKRSRSKPFGPIGTKRINDIEDD